MTTPSAFDELAAACTDAIEARLLEVLAAGDPVENLHEAALYGLGLDQEDRAVRGKRIRPVLCLVTAQALGAPIGRALPFACAIELFHNFALVHDDIEDGDDTRRNRPAVHARHGVPHGINIGDFLFAKVWTTLLDPSAGWDDATRLRLCRLMADTIEHTITGQALDMNARQSRDFRVRDYFRLATDKTGFYLAAPILGGAIAAGAPDALLDPLSRYGHAMGPLFQIVDDLLDLTAGKGRGGLIGSDLREGKRSYLVAAATERADAAARERLYDILDAPRGETTDAMVADAVAIFEECGALDTARARCEQLLDEGIAALAEAPADLALLLGEFARRMASRTT